MPKNKFNIAVITGTRAEFGIFRPVLDAIRATPPLNLQLIVTGMHLQKNFGHTITDIQKSGYPIAARVPMYSETRNSKLETRNLSHAAALARGIANMAATFQKLKPNLVMLLGDRLEILAAASAALTLQIPIAHLHGGETAPAQWDEQIRHAVTKMAHLHFCATPNAAKRIRQLGEPPSTIHLVGAPALDLATRAAKLMSVGKTPKQIRPLLVLHPSSASDTLEEERTTTILQTLLKNFPAPISVIGPNNDPGHRGILRAYEKAKFKNQINLTMSVPQNLFWGLMNEHRLLVGNSSAGIIEAATFATAVINIGPRQSGRDRSPNVLDTDFSQKSIAAAIHTVLSDAKFRRQLAQCKNIYGTGTAAPRIAAILKKLAGTSIPTTKSFADL